MIARHEFTIDEIFVVFILNFLPCDYMLPSTPCERPWSYRSLDRIVLGDDFSIGALEDKVTLQVPNFIETATGSLSCDSRRPSESTRRQSGRSPAGRAIAFGLGKRNSVKRDLDHATAA